MLHYADFKATNLSPFRCTAASGFLEERDGKVSHHGEPGRPSHRAGFLAASVERPIVHFPESLDPAADWNGGRRLSIIQRRNARSDGGGKFWKPYGSANTKDDHGKKLSGDANVPAGMDPNLYEYRPPIDLTNAKLRKLAAALGPAYVRVSGTWANTTYFADSDQPPSSPPSGFQGVLSRQQWRGVIDFAAAVNARIVTSMATSQGVRDTSSVWTPEQAKRLIDFTRSAGGDIAAAEFMNEPTMAAMGGAPKGYDAAAYGRDFKVFESFARLRQKC
jgi:hypothetical protein